jgi:hypothetical protein
VSATSTPGQTSATDHQSGDVVQPNPGAMATGMKRKILVASVLGVAIAVVVGLAVLNGTHSKGGGSGGSGTSAGFDRCLQSRLANGGGDQMTGGESATAIATAQNFCGMGAQFDGTTAPASGVGPNTAAW